MIEWVWYTCVGRPEGRRRGEAAAPQQPRVGGHPAPGGAARLGGGGLEGGQGEAAQGAHGGHGARGHGQGVDRALGGRVVATPD